MPHDVSHNLPNEILSSIFIRLLENGPKSKEGTRPMEVIVSHVNHRWRTIALNLPALWNSFRFIGGEQATVPVERLATYLKRSDSYPLDFWFDLRDLDHGRWGDTKGCIDFVLQTVPHVARWRRFTILLDGVYESFHFIALHFKELCAPNLEYFAIVPNQHEEQRMEVSAGGPNSIEPQIFSGGAPKLTSVFLDTLTTGSHCMPPLSNVATLTLLRYDTVGDSITPDVLYSILALPQLTNLAFVGKVCGEGIDRQIDMPNLKNFRLGNEAIAGSLLLNLQAPLLETLTICSIDLDFTDRYRITDIDVPSDQFPSLHTLSLVDVQFRTSSQESRPILRQLTKGIKHLVVSVNGENKDDDSPEDDPPEDEGGYLWTALETVSFNVKKPVDPKSFCHIRSEIQGDQITLQLHEILLSSWREDHPKFLEQLQRVYTLVLMDDGHPVRVTSLSTQGEGPGGLGDITDPFYLDFLLCNHVSSGSYSGESDSESNDSGESE